MIFAFIIVILVLVFVLLLIFYEYLPKKIFIRHVINVKEVNIYGKPTKYESCYVICRTTFGLFPRYVYVDEDDGEISWFSFFLTEKFKSYEEAENRLYELATNSKYWQDPPSI